MGRSSRQFYFCADCSHCVVTNSAGFVREVTWKCLDRGGSALTGANDMDGCTFGDDSGQLIGAIAYDIDLSLTRQEYDE